MTNGANGALNVIINALVNSKKDEVVVFEPCFPPYFDHLELAGGSVKTVGLFLNEKTGRFGFSKEDLERVVSDRTRIVILNTPHNPTGKCFTKAELLEIT